MEALQEEQEGEEGNKTGREVISEYGEGQARLCHCVPRALDEMLVEKRKVHMNTAVDTYTQRGNV